MDATYWKNNGTIFRRILAFFRSSQASTERCLHYICTTLQNQLTDRLSIKFIAKLLKQLWNNTLESSTGDDGKWPSSRCECGGKELINALVSCNLPLEQSIEIAFSITFSRWICEVLLALPYKSELEVLFVNYTLATVLLKKV